jgi:rhodanese-related sulfurtransferase
VKFILDNWMLIALALTSGTLLLVPTLQGAVASGLSANDAVLLINRERAVVVDVCEPAEFAAGHIVGARNIPLGELDQKLASAAKNKNLPLILVCQSGARSGRALAAAQALGYTQVHSLSGGLSSWKSAGLPLEKA